MKQKAFTLIEYLVVLTIIAIIAAALVPSIQTYLPGLQMTGSSRNLVNDLRQAQEETITTQTRHAIRFNTTDDPMYYQLIELGDTETVLKTVKIPSGMSLTLDSSITDSQVVFSADGGPSSSGNVIITKNSANKTINISPAGVIKLQG